MTVDEQAGEPISNRRVSQNLSVAHRVRKPSQLVDSWQPGYRSSHLDPSQSAICTTDFERRPGSLGVNREFCPVSIREES
jgi:hypothetical protein